MDLNYYIESTTSEAVDIVGQLKIVQNNVLKAQLKRLENIILEDFVDTPAREQLFANIKIQRDRIQSKIKEL